MVDTDSECEIPKVCSDPKLPYKNLGAPYNKAGVDRARQIQGLYYSCRGYEFCFQYSHQLAHVNSSSRGSVVTSLCRHNNHMCECIHVGLMGIPCPPQDSGHLGRRGTREVLTVLTPARV